MYQWKAKLFGCADAPKSCVWSCLVPCGIPCMQGAAARLMVKEDYVHIKACLFAVFLSCIGTGINRGEIRASLMIKGSFLEDCVLTWFLPCCSMVQEWREVMNHKGKDEDELIWRTCSDYYDI